MTVENETWYDVYALVDPFEREPFYVGITDDFMSRYIQHVKLKDDNAAKNARIVDIYQRGALPIINRLIRVKGKSGATDFEALFIEVFRILNYPLTNRELRLFTNSEHRQKVLIIARDIAESWKPSNFPFQLYDGNKLQPMYDQFVKQNVEVK